MDKRCPKCYYSKMDWSAAKRRWICPRCGHEEPPDWEKAATITLYLLVIAAGFYFALVVAPLAGPWY